MATISNRSDVILIGAGIMSATLGAFLHEVEPDWTITTFESLAGAGEESSNEWNNAGTGHSALCELNYTVEKSDGSMDISKAIRINEQFQLSRQFWSYLIDQGRIANPQEFIMPLPHISFVEGEKNVNLLRKRYAALKDHPMFEGMEYTEDPAKLAEWLPLMMENRVIDGPIAATRINKGTDVNFGALTRTLYSYLEKDTAVHYNHKVLDISRGANQLWNVTVQNKRTGEKSVHTAKFVFIGAGGATLPLLQKSGIPEGKGIGGFPISGLFLVCENEAIVDRHFAKVYSKAKIGAPPMSVPHLDTRYIDGKRSLLFGPFAGFSPKFLKTGSYLDLIKSVKPHNLINMCMAGIKELGLVKYLIEQLLLSDKQKIKELQNFVPDAQLKDWRVVIAGQRVQIIKETKENGKGTLQFGTEVITAADGSIAALLGASPGASTGVQVVLDIFERCFADRKENWLPKIKAIIPTYGTKLETNPDLYNQVQDSTGKTLQLIK